jgi:predicted lactoylglutathione lyase
MHFPPTCPEIPVTDLARALAYYRDRLGFTIDWADEGAEGLAGVSRGDSRLFMTTRSSRSDPLFQGPVVLWLNLSNRAEIDALHGEWAKAGVIIAAPPAAKPYNLYEFFAKDLDGNCFRVFYDFRLETEAGQSD